MPPESKQIECLRAEIAKLQKELEKTRLKEQKAAKRCLQAEKRLGLTEQKLQHANEERDIVKALLYYCHGDVLKLVTASLEMLKEFYPDIPAARADQFQWLINKAGIDMEDILETGKEAFLAYLLSTGTESLTNVLDKVKDVSVQQLRAQATKEITGQVISIAQQESNMHPVINVLSSAAIEAAKANPDDQVLQAAGEIAQAEVKARPAPAPKAMPETGKKTAGRQALKAKQTVENIFEAKLPEQADCPKCGQKHPVTQVSTLHAYLRTVSHSLRELLAEGDFACPVVACRQCGTVFAARPAQMPVPYSHAAGCQASADLIVEYGNLVASGIPGNRIDGLLGSDKVDQLATENFNRALQTWSTTGIGAILAEQIKAAGKQAKYLGADETEFPVLEKENYKGKSHLLVCTSEVGEEQPFVAYEYMPSRSGQSIAEHLKDWNFEVLSRDGYEGYNAAFKTDGLNGREVTVQVCLTHARRRICNAVNVESFQDLINTPDAIQQAAARYKNHSSTCLLFSALDCLRKLYAEESTGKRKATETRQQQLDRIRKYRKKTCAPLMDKIDTIMLDLAATHAIRQENGSWQCQRSGSAIGKAVIFWLNNRKLLRSFLDDPRITPDNNNTERSVRAIMAYRNAAFFKRSEDGARSFCNLLTLRETGKLNGIKDVPAWIKSVHRAFYEHVERSVWANRYIRLKPDEELALRIPKITPELIKSFDWEPWLPWNYAQRLQAGERCKPI